MCGLLANASTDLGYRDAAAEQARAAWAYGDIIGHNGLRAWTRGMQALIEYWSGRPQQAVRLAQSARRYADSATARVRLHSIEARAWSLLGDAREASRCMGAAAEARESPAGGDYLHDEVGGVFGFADTKNYCYAGAAFIHLGQADAALNAATAAPSSCTPPVPRRSVRTEPSRWPGWTWPWPTCSSSVWTARPKAWHRCSRSRLACASPSSGTGWPMSGSVLAGAEFSGAREARDLRDRIDNFVRRDYRAGTRPSRPCPLAPHDTPRPACEPRRRHLPDHGHRCTAPLRSATMTDRPGLPAARAADGMMAGG